MEGRSVLHDDPQSVFIDSTRPCLLEIGNDVQIAKGVGIAVNEDCNLVFGREIRGSYQMKTAATADDISALATRVSALEDLLKLA